MRVFLNAGHGGRDTGATADDFIEKEINLVVMLKCKEELERHGIEVVCSRLADEDDRSRDVVVEIEKAKPMLAVSFHTNAGGGNGFEAYVNPLDKEAVKLAGLCEMRVMELKQNSRGIKNGNWLYLIKKAGVPIVVLESFFLDNLEDRKIGDSIDKQKKFGVAYAKAILDYLGVVYIEDNQKYYKVQVGAFLKRSNAEKMVKELAEKGIKAIITT